MRLRALLLLPLLLVACRSKNDATKTTTHSASAPSAPAPAVVPAVVKTGPRAIRGRPKDRHELSTTSGAIAMANVEGQIKDLTRMSANAPTNVTFLQGLGTAHHVHGRVLGDLDELDQSIQISTKCITLEPTVPRHYLERSIRQQTLHRFSEARADLEKARTLGADADALAGIQAEIDWNSGVYAPAIAQFRAARLKKPSIGTWTREGILDYETGDYESADRAFEEAEDQMSDTSPFPVAQIDMTRGIQKQHTGNFDAAVFFFRESLQRLPMQIPAAEHLAETLHWMGQDDEATSIYEDIVKRSTDPEFMGALAALYGAHGKTKEAAQLKAKATTRYAELIVKYPEAMYWHAAEYFLGTGNDPKKALELLTKNIELRPNATAYTGLAKAQLANGKVDEARESVGKAIDSPVVSAEAFFLAAKIAKKSGDTAKTGEYFDRAKKINPRIEDIEGKLE